MGEYIHGLIGGSFSPMHRGHFNLVKFALKECDVVHLFVSLKGRARTGEVEVTTEAKRAIWTRFLVPALNSLGVEVTFAEVSPISSIYGFLQSEEKSGAMNQLNIYSDVDDLAKNYPDARLMRIAPTLMAHHKILKRPVPRGLTAGISGTQMRMFLQTGLKDEFIAGLPEIVQDHGDEIWDILGGEEV